MRNCVLFDKSESYSYPIIIIANGLWYKVIPINFDFQQMSLYVIKNKLNYLRTTV